MGLLLDVWTDSPGSHHAGEWDVRRAQRRAERAAGAAVRSVPSGHSTERRPDVAVVHCTSLGQPGRAHASKSVGCRLLSGRKRRISNHWVSVFTMQDAKRRPRSPAGGARQQDAPRRSRRTPARANSLPGERPGRPCRAHPHGRVVGEHAEPTQAAAAGSAPSRGGSTHPSTFATSVAARFSAGIRPRIGRPAHR